MKSILQEFLKTDSKDVIKTHEPKSILSGLNLDNVKKTYKKEK